MTKFILAAGLLSLLAACSSMSGGGSTSGSMGSYDTMGAQSVTMQSGSGPRGGSSGGPN